jgi:hypothetical protein
MTLILTAVTADWKVLHASDRLVSKKVGSGPHTEHDPDTNKTVVVLTDWCFLVVGYSGRAYFGSFSTDQFMAKAITRHGFTPGQWIGVGDGFLDGVNLDYHQIMQRLLSELRSSYQKGRDPANGTPLTLAVGGWEILKKQDPSPNVPKKTRQILKTIVVDSSGVSQTNYAKKSARTNIFGYQYSAIGWLDAEVERKFNTLGQIPYTSAEQSVSEFIRLIEDTGKRSVPVGESAMSVILEPRIGLATIAFHGPDTAQLSKLADKSSKGEFTDAPTLVTPYVLIGGGPVIEPTILLGNMEFSGGGGYRVRVTAWDSPAIVPMRYAVPQHRMPPPRR